MSVFPTEPKKIRARIRRYERELRKEQDKFGYIRDGYGKRYLLGPLYLLMGDVEGAVKSFEWFEETFPDDSGESAHFLCWTLALYRSGDEAQAAQRLRQAMLSNLYLIPHLLGREQDELGIWYHTNYEEKDFLEYVPPEIWTLWDAPALQWAEETYDSPELQRIRARYIEIREQLTSEQRTLQRSVLVIEMFRLQAAKLE